MTDREDDPEAAAGIPERVERTESGRHVTESGRHVTNRNVVPRSATPRPGSRDRVERGQRPVDDEVSDLITPVRPPPREAFADDDATAPRDDARAMTPADPSNTAARRRSHKRTGGALASSPARSPRIMPTDAGFTPPELRRPITERMARVTPAPDAELASAPAARASEPARSERPVRAPSDGGFIPPESRRPASERVLPVGEIPVDGPRPTTVRGHVEPRRRPTTPPPPERAGGAAPTGSGSSAVPAPVVGSAGSAEPRPASARVVDRAGERPGDRSTERPTDPGSDRSREPASGPASEPATIPLPYGRSPERSYRDPPRSLIGRSSGATSPYDRSYDSAQPTASTAPAPPDRVPRGPAAVSQRLDRALRGAAIALVGGAGALGLALSSSVLVGGVAWLAFLVFVLAGWGAIVLRLARVDDGDLGLRAALGAAGLLATAGPLLAAGLLARPAILGLVAIGFAGFAWRELTAPVAMWRRVHDGFAFVRNQPALAALIATLVAAACLRMLGAVAALESNPWDDDLAYTQLVKRLLDVGDLIEPFSFRRLGAYGGQTVLQAMGAARGSLANVHLIDQGLGFGLVMLSIVGYARERRTQPLWLALIAAVLLVLPDTAINTASHWTALLGFLVLYRCLVREHWVLVGLTAAATCTLRQNFLVPVAVLVGAVLIGRLVALCKAMPVRDAWYQERRGWVLTAGVALAVIAPWWIAAYLSNHTFLFPLFDGTWNHALSLRPAVVTWPQELGFLLTACLDAAPLSVIPILTIATLFVSDRRPGRPLAALAIASALGFALLVHSFVGGEIFALWRYAFGFTTALAVALVLEIGASDDTEIAIPVLGRWLILAALVLQIAFGRTGLTKQTVALFDGIREAQAVGRRGEPSGRAAQRRYGAMQSAIPVGGRAVIMLDDPAMLDYHRNPLANLDTPGFASPGPQLPAFAGAEPLRGYLVAQGYRYAAFVRSERSRYFFRRAAWLERVFIDTELFQLMAAYTIDAIDSLAELATTTKVLYDSDGLVVLDLATPLRDASRRVLRGDEPARRAAWVRALADREDRHDAWSLTTRDDVRFEDGVAAVRYVEIGGDEPQPSELDRARAAGAPRLLAVLPVQRRVHLRVRGGRGPAGLTDMRFALRAALALNTVYTHPRLDVSLDGELLASAVADAAGRYAITATVGRDRLAGGWHDLYLVFSSVAEPEREIRELRIARLESVEWSPP
jgi:hypothetical protein